MARYRSFLFPESILEKDSILLDSRESYHLVRVLRARVEETVEILDGKGTRYLGTLETIDPRAVRVSVKSRKSEPLPKPRVQLVQSEFKGKSMDIVLRMATELGAFSIQPVFTDQGDTARPNLEKRRRILIEACKQCGLSFIPELYDPCHLDEWLQRNVAKTTGELRLVASLQEASQPILSVLEESAGNLEEVIVAVGPVGDFSAAEYESLHKNGFQAVRLGRNTLRVETAVAYVFSILDQMLNLRQGDAGKVAQD